MLPPLKPLPIKDRRAMLFLKYGQLDVIDGAFVLVDKEGVRTHIPIGTVACLMLEPGTRVSHAAVKLAATAGTLLVWVGEAGVRLYAAGQPGGARSDRLLYQAKLALDDDLRLKVVRKMFELRFGEPPPSRRSVDQLRGIEGARVRETYKLLAARYGVKWQGRRYDPKNDPEFLADARKAFKKWKFLRNAGDGPLPDWARTALATGDVSHLSKDDREFVESLRGQR